MFNLEMRSTTNYTFGSAPFRETAEPKRLISHKGNETTADKR